MSIDTSKIIYSEPRHIVEPSFENSEVKPSYLRSKLSYDNNNYITVTSPKLEVFSINGNYIELSIQKKERNKIFYGTIASLENSVIEQSFKNSKQWFKKELPYDDIKNMFKSSIMRPNSIDGSLIIKLKLSDGLELPIEGDLVVVTIKFSGVIYSKYSCSLVSNITNIQKYKPKKLSFGADTDIDAESDDEIGGTTFNVGDTLQMSYNDSYFICTVIRVSEDEKYTVRFEDDSEEENVDVSLLRSIRSLPEIAVPSVDDIIKSAEIVNTIVNGPSEVPLEVPAEIPIEVPLEVPAEVPLEVPAEVVKDIVNEVPTLDDIIAPITEVAEIKQEVPLKESFGLPVHPYDVSQETKLKIKKAISEAIFADDHEKAFKLQSLLKSLD